MTWAAKVQALDPALSFGTSNLFPGRSVAARRLYTTTAMKTALL